MTFSPEVQFYRPNSDGSWTGVHNVKFKGQGAERIPGADITLNPDGSWTNLHTLNYAIRKGKKKTAEEQLNIHDLDVASWIAWSIGFPYKANTAVNNSSLNQWSLRPLHLLNNKQKRWALLAWVMFLGGISVLMSATLIPQSPILTAPLVLAGFGLIWGGAAIAAIANHGYERFRESTENYYALAFPGPRSRFWTTDARPAGL